MTKREFRYFRLLKARKGTTLPVIAVPHKQLNKIVDDLVKSWSNKNTHNNRG